MDVNQARAAVARQIVHNALDSIEWENYPEIGEYDWNEVLRICRLQAPGDHAFAAAYAWLAERANHSGKGDGCEQCDGRGWVANECAQDVPCPWCSA